MSTDVSLMSAQCNVALSSFRTSSEDFVGYAKKYQPPVINLVTSFVIPTF